MEEARMGEKLLVLKFKSGNFSLEKAVCNHGFFMMAPNHWIPSTKTLRRPLRLADSTTCVNVSISQERVQEKGSEDVIINILVHSHVDLSLEDTSAIKAQVSRMLRISEKDERDVAKFHQLHPRAKERVSGRIFRSPTLFEDIIKCILLCYSSWRGTLRMAKSLCEMISQDKEEGTRKRKREWNFPNASELACQSEEALKKRCKLGHRAKYILKVAKDVSSGRLKLKALEEETFAFAYKKLSKMKGFGHFARANVLMCIGFYELVPTDSETIRHFKQVHHRESCNLKTVRKDAKEIYDKYAPFQCLAYWMEMMAYYENCLGKLSDLPSSAYSTVTGTLL